MIVVEKHEGETPLESLERTRRDQGIAANIPMTYAGRLDPMASGKLLILVGEECKQKERYLGLDKEYEVEILFGVETDTQDVLGLVTNVAENLSKPLRVSEITEISENLEKIDFQKYVGIFEQKYPAYSSKTVGGKQLHTHAREGTLPDPEEMPRRQIKIYSIDEISRRTLTGSEIAAQVIERISKVSGDFRQNEIMAAWRDFGDKNMAQNAQKNFTIIKIRVRCGTGTYMRSLAERIGDDAGCSAIAFSIHRTKIGEF